MTIVTLEVGSPKLNSNRDAEEKYKDLGVHDIVRERGGWLLFFFVGLMLAAVVVESFEKILKEHVQLSYFVPLLIGHGGNTGAQSNATIIRALALGQLRYSDIWSVIRKEAIAGGAMGALLGSLILACSFVWKGLPFEVAATVAVSLPVVSIWANILGGVFPLISARFGYNPAVTSAPLMTTVVDATGLAIYLWIGKLVMGL